MKHLPVQLLTLLAVVGLAWTANAQTTDTLQHLVDTHGSLTIGDKTFSNFAFNASNLTNFNASQIQVTASVESGVYFLTWGGNISLVSNSSATADLLLNYKVVATSGFMNMIDQLYTGSAQPNSGAFLSIDETVRDAQGNLVANSHLQADDLSDPFAEPGDNLNINPPKSVLSVTKDIGLGLSNNGGFINISEVRQSFHQVPEAATTAMLVVGLSLIAVAAVFRRKRS